MLQVTNTNALNNQINANDAADLAIETKAATVVTMRHHHSVSGMSSKGGNSGSMPGNYYLPGLIKRWLCHCCDSLKRSWPVSVERNVMSGMFFMPVQPVVVRKPGRSLSDY